MTTINMDMKFGIKIPKQTWLTLWKPCHLQSPGLLPPSTCIWNLKLKFQRKLDLCSGNHVVYRQTDGRTDGRTRWIQYTPPPTWLGRGINISFNHYKTGTNATISVVNKTAWGINLILSTPSNIHLVFYHTVTNHNKNNAIQHIFNEDQVFPRDNELNHGHIMQIIQEIRDISWKAMKWMIHKHATHYEPTSANLNIRYMLATSESKRFAVILLSLDDILTLMVSLLFDWINFWTNSQVASEMRWLGAQLTSP